MSYERISKEQRYGSQSYLSHQISGNIESNPFYVVGDRVSSYGIINLGYLSARQKKRFKPIDYGINSDILLRSLYAFTTAPTAEEVTIRLFLDNTEFLEQKISDSEMPYTFPPGAIVNPNLELEVEPRYNTAQIVIYWQPVHVISYVEVN